jgi:hypothetical protein
MIAPLTRWLSGRASLTDAESARAGTVSAKPVLMRAIALFCLLVPAAFSAPIERELGSGLVYFRVQALPADLPAKSVGRVSPCVVDVRYVDATPEAATAFSSWLRSRASTRSPVFVLANEKTSPSLLKVLATHGRGTGIAVVGIEGGGFRPDVAVKGSPDDERRAYEALENGAALATLLTDHPNKVRNDEASLSKDRLAEAAAEAADDAGKKAPPPIDAALQRAVHLHRALVALKKI